MQVDNLEGVGESRKKMMRQTERGYTETQRAREVVSQTETQRQRERKRESERERNS